MAADDKQAARVELIALPGVPLVAPGDDLATIALEAAARAGIALRDGDILVFAQKIVSKSEGRAVRLSTVTPSPRAIELAKAADKDPRVVELILAESTEVLRCRPGAIVVTHRRGWVLANAGIDQSNVTQDGDGSALLLPEDPDGSATAIREAVKARAGVDVGIIINDSFGRAWRLGTIGTAIGAAGLPSLLDLRGKPDLFGRSLMTTEVGHGDEIASAASLVMGQAAEGCPIVLVRGVPRPAEPRPAASLVRPREMDLFR